MKRRLRKIINFFAFNLLFFALYLNFIHKENPNGNNAPVPVATQPAISNAGFTGTVLVQNPEKYLNKEVKTNQNNQQ